MPVGRASKSSAVTVVVVLGIISEMAGVVAVQIGAERRYDGPLGKSDRALLFGALGLWVGLGLPLPGWSWLILAMAALLLALTVANRVRAGLREAAR